MKPDWGEQRKKRSSSGEKNPSFRDETGGQGARTPGREWKKKGFLVGRKKRKKAHPTREKKRSPSSLKESVQGPFFPGPGMAPEKVGKGKSVHEKVFSNPGWGKKEQGTGKKRGVAADGGAFLGVLPSIDKKKRPKGREKFTIQKKTRP